jgi:hypothetical protein
MMTISQFRLIHAMCDWQSSTPSASNVIFRTVLRGSRDLNQSHNCILDAILHPEQNDGMLCRSKGLRRGNGMGVDPRKSGRWLAGKSGDQ